jgi:RNA polymerase sigma-70 factor (ECF subfamily)
LAVRLSKEDRKQMADKINYDLFEQIAVERSEIAFSEFYDRFAPRVYSMLLRLVRTKEDANDLLQEVFILVWNKAPSLYKMHGNPVPWLIQLTRNRAMDEIRSRKYKSRSKDESFDAVRHDLLTDDSTPEADFVTIESRTEIQNALSALSPRQRKAIEMVFFGGMTFQETADSLQIPSGSVGAIIRQAIVKLGDVLKPRMGIALNEPTKNKRKSNRSTLRWKKIDEAVIEIKDEG